MFSFILFRATSVFVSCLVDRAGCRLFVLFFFVPHPTPTSCLLVCIFFYLSFPSPSFRPSEALPVNYGSRFSFFFQRIDRQDEWSAQRPCLEPHGPTMVGRLRASEEDGAASSSALHNPEGWKRRHPRAPTGTHPPSASPVVPARRHRHSPPSAPADAHDPASANLIPPPSLNPPQSPPAPCPLQPRPTARSARPVPPH